MRQITTTLMLAALSTVLLAGCGGTTSGSDAKAAPSPTPTRGLTYYEKPYEPPASGPEEKINALAAQHGWTVDDSLYPSPSAYVHDICDSLPDQADSGPAQWLAENGATTPDLMSVLTTGIPLLCPEWTKTVKQAAAGHYPVDFANGTFKVSSRRADDTVPPGTYRTTGDLSGCYWERTKADGTIIDNNLATAATRITVTILPSDDLFTSQDCGTWKPVG